MAYSTPYTFTALELLTAAKMNAIQANITAIWVGTTAGDMDYYTSATGKNRVAIGANTTTVLMPSAGAPSWNHSPQIQGVLHNTATVYWNGEVTKTGTTFTDITSATVNIVTTQTCTIRMLAQGAIASGTVGNRTSVQGSINGTADANHDDSKAWTTAGNYVPYLYVYRLTGVAAGTITCKMQYKGGGGTALHSGGRIIVEAYVE